MFRLVMENSKGRPVMDQTDALLLRRIGEKGSLTEGARAAGVSYRSAWDRIKSMEKKIGEKLVETQVGGTEGGGAILTEDAEALLREFRKTRKFLLNNLDDKESWEDISYRLSARNRLRARVVDVRKGPITSQVKMRLVAETTMTSVITNDAVEDLALAQGDEVEAIVKSTDVLVAKTSGSSRR
jgi:molybdate transport system regulatory protein